MLRFAFALAVLLAACAAPDEPTPAPAPRETTPPVISGGAASQDADAAIVLALDAEGLRVVDADAGTARPVAFGTPEEEAVAAVEAVRGMPAERAENAECGAGPLTFATWPDGFAMLSQDGTFAGWSQSPRDDASSTLTTMSGLGVGSTRAELDAVYAATVDETSLGTEFSTGDLFGLLSGPGSDATIEHLWAGVSCTFR